MEFARSKIVPPESGSVSVSDGLRLCQLSGTLQLDVVPSVILDTPYLGPIYDEDVLKGVGL